MSDHFKITLEQQSGFQFLVKFDEGALLQMDEPAPLGAGQGPNASRLLAAAAANCLSASLLFCLQKFKETPGPIVTEVSGQMVRNAQGRMRVGGLDVRIRMADRLEDLQRLQHCAAGFEDFCVVTASIREGIPVAVRIVDADGVLVHESAGDR